MPKTKLLISPAHPSLLLPRALYAPQLSDSSPLAAQATACRAITPDASCMLPHQQISLVLLLKQIPNFLNTSAAVTTLVQITQSL